MNKNIMFERQKKRKPKIGDIVMIHNNKIGILTDKGITQDNGFVMYRIEWINYGKNSVRSIWEYERNLEKDKQYYIIFPGPNKE